jgi:hypothetical protein
MEDTADELGNRPERRKKKVRIRYRERIRIKERPRFFYTKRFIRKQLPKVVAGLLLLAAVGAGIYYAINMMVSMEKERKEKIELQKSGAKKKK